MMKTSRSLSGLFLALFVGIAASAQTDIGTYDHSGIEYIDIIHCSHTDYGFTDHPYIVEDLQLRFLDIAIDAASASSHLPTDERFYWTAEALDIVWRWWQNAAPDRKSELKRLIDNGQIEITALPFNVHPFLNVRQWDLSFNWIPDPLWEDLKIKVGIQHDVNGFSRSSAIRLLDKGVKYIWNGINTYWGGAPFPQPSGFWWIMPDKRKILVWQSYPYWFGYNLLTERDWRLIQTPASNTQFRTPRINDILPADEESVREAHATCLKKIKKMREEGYPYDFIAVCITNQWRIDNDGPFPPLVDFVKKWNDLGLMPKLRLTTAANAMDRIEKRVGRDLPVYSGEWTDWWAFGAAATPREMAASRHAGNYVQAALSPVWGGNSEKVVNQANGIDRSLCRFYEHTFAANEATSNPYGFFNLGHLAEKSIYAYRPYEQAKNLVAQRMRQLFTNQPEGLYVVNAGEHAYTGWIELDRISFREVNYQSVRDPVSGEKKKLYSTNRIAKFWVDKFKANSVGCFLLSEDSVSEVSSRTEPEITVDASGWPSSVRWKGMQQPLFSGEIGKFLSQESVVGREIEPKIWDEGEYSKRKANIDKSTKLTGASPDGTATITETAFSISYKQNFAHPRLKQGQRILEIWKDEPRVSINIRFYRLSSPNPEIFYIEFPLPDEGANPVISNGGMEFRPYLDQIPGTCMDFFAIDGWVNYPAPTGSRLWSSRDAALISFSEPQLASKLTSPPPDMNKILAMVYNNMWEVNFLDDCPGEMEFHFDLTWKNRPITAKEAYQITRTYNLPPLVMLNPTTREDPFTFKRMNEIK
ncbi:MAG: hypothetical protein A2X22_09560 [Bacteroidetes bacterium GWF2_49_14]|nr:MAG: hypothetical protein A2X22_09560 [Bacteroidetes bacterium GWF2_49_14]HBB92606.1 hypothetical protein [Bacteroidales bacterium]